MYTPTADLTYEQVVARNAPFPHPAVCGWTNATSPAPCPDPARWDGAYCDAHWCMVNGIANPKGLIGVDGPVYTGGPEPRKGGTGGGETDPVRAARVAEATAYVNGYTGKWGLILDLRADRKWGTKWFRMSDRLVEILLAGKARDEAFAKERAEREQARPVAPAASPVTEGWYRDGEGIAKVQKAVHGSGNLYAKRLVVGDGEPRWEYVPGLVRTLRPEDALTVEEAARFGHLYGVCAVCGRVLTDEKSINAGIGPVCIRRLG